MTDINTTLSERGERYGAFRDHAVIAQNLKQVMWGTGGWMRLAPNQKQALEVIADKIARILNGDPNYVDNWHDIIGYAKLVENDLNDPCTIQAKPEVLDEYARIDMQAWDHLPPAADADPESVIVQRSKIRDLIDEFWRQRAAENKA